MKNSKKVNVIKRQQTKPVATNAQHDNEEVMLTLDTAYGVKIVLCLKQINENEVGFFSVITKDGESKYAAQVFNSSGDVRHYHRTKKAS